MSRWAAQLMTTDWESPNDANAPAPRLPKRGRGRSRLVRLVFWLLAALLVLAGLELGLHVFYLIAFQRPFSFSEYGAAMSRLARSHAEGTTAPIAGAGVMVIEDQNAIEVIHPYVGWVRDPNAGPGVSRLGLHDPEVDLLAPPPPGVMTVAVFGGSFARQLTTVGRPYLEEELRASGRLVRVVSVAIGAYKQPQQLNTLSMLLSLGAHFDVVVNLDGFNEIALGPAVNLPKGVTPIYPTGWYYRVMNLSDRVALRSAGKVELLRDWRGGWAALMESLPGRWSIARCGLWRAVDKVMQRAMLLEIDRAGRAAASARTYLISGPDLVSSAPEKLYPFLADHWASCSLQMDALCRRAGAAYFHFLQPNQYDEGSKTLTEQERKQAFEENNACRPSVLAGYPLLRERGARLSAQGVRFEDLSMIYRDKPQTLWADVCCHPNREGYEIVARRVGQRIREYMDTEPSGGK
ncbi:MAG: hypothetical protein N2111_00560 [Candidatus Sumerlaeaceae bacterium]|nr:hypothetical protein [Candidatus Sumerlaeaceae bacterium]